MFGEKGRLDFQNIPSAKALRELGVVTLPAANKWQPLTASNMLGETSGWAGRCDCARDCFTFFTSTRHRARSSPERKGAAVVRGPINEVMEDNRFPHD